MTLNQEAWEAYQRLVHARRKLSEAQRKGKTEHVLKQYRAAFEQAFAYYTAIRLRQE